ncbi:AAA-like domain protein [Gimesia alba]|uniref:AAA-like domain protein n=1 Tax=Gimesia alba TaxID=2527973 RepID=A0A517R914_9PLAN|nr:hypothetical protein [Gimesia alba]QDT40348.1 AAA-like domain protein [Gimesia alba]
MNQLSRTIRPKRLSRTRRHSFFSSKQLFAESQAGIFISGDSGFGKSNAMKVLMQLLAILGYGFLFISPHGSDPRDILSWCMAQKASIRNRVVYIDPAETSRTTCINPLAVESTRDPIQYRARLVSKIGHVCRILLSAWGEEDFDSRPRLFTWTMRILKTLAELGLPLADAKHFLDVGSDVYNALVQAVPDVMARHFFENLAAGRPQDIREEIESTRNRILGFFSNPIIEAMLSRTSGVLDFGQLRRKNAIVIVNLRQGGVLREEDQQILANLFLAELLHDVFNSDTPTPYFAFLDELPVFARGSGPELTAAAGQIRKFLLRLVCATQGANPFPDRVDDRLLNALIGQCGLHFLFRHKHPYDAKFFGEIIGFPTYDPQRVKHQTVQSQQYQAGHDLVTLMDFSESESETRGTGGSESNGVTETEQWSDTQSHSVGSSTSHSESSSQTTGTSQNPYNTQLQQIRQAVSDARSSTAGQSENRTDGRSSTTGGSKGHSHQTSQSWSQSVGKTRGRTFKQSLVPRLLWRDVVTGVTFYSPQEHQLMYATRLASLQIGEAIVYGPGKPMRIQFPLAQDPARWSPRFVARRMEHYLDLLAQVFPSPQQVLAERQQELEAIIHNLGLALPEQDAGDDPFPS